MQLKPTALFPYRNREKKIVTSANRHKMIYRIITRL